MLAPGDCVCSWNGMIYCSNVASVAGRYTCCGFDILFCGAVIERATLLRAQPRDATLESEQDRPTDDAGYCQQTGGASLDGIRLLRHGAGHSLNTCGTYARCKRERAGEATPTATLSPFPSLHGKEQTGAAPTAPPRFLTFLVQIAPCQHSPSNRGTTKQITKKSRLLDVLSCWHHEIAQTAQTPRTTMLGDCRQEAVAALG